MFCLTKFSCNAVPGVAYVINTILGDAWYYNNDKGLIEISALSWVVPINYADPRVTYINILTKNVRINYKISEETVHILIAKGLIRFGKCKLDRELTRLVSRVAFHSNDKFESELEQVLRYYLQSIKANLTSIGVTTV